MKIGLYLLLIGLLLLSFAYISYRRSESRLQDVKKEDLVTYYLDLAYQLFPIPFWCGVVGITTTLAAVIVIIIYLPVVF